MSRVLGRGIIIILLVLVFVLFTDVCSDALFKGKAVTEADRKRELVKEAKEKLNNTSWEIELTQMGSSGKKEKDTVIFREDTIESVNLKTEGFPPTSFTVSIKKEDVIVWETMQTSEKKGLAFWRGEIEKGVMRGVLSRHISQNTVRDYSFVSRGKEDVALEAAAVTSEPSPEKEVAQKEEVEEVKPAPSTVKKEEPKPAKEEPKKKRKWWWQR